MARTPRIRYLRNRQFDRTRHSSILLAWLAAQATRLATSAQTVFNMLLSGKTAEQVEGITGTFPVNTVAPAITGTPTSGQTLTVSNGTWTGSPTPTYTRQWRRNGVNISGATATTYLLVAGDVGAIITVVVTATNALGSVTKVSNSVGPVAAT